MELEWDCQTTFWPSSSFADAIGDDSNLRMMAEDAGTEIWAHFDRRSRGNQRIATIEDCSPHLSDLLFDAIPDRHGYGRELAGSLGNFGMMVARELVLSGELNYELCFGKQRHGEASVPAGISIRYIPHDSLVRAGRRWFQVVPKGARKSDDPGQVVSLDAGRVIQFVPPKAWQSHLNRIRESLPEVGRSQREWMNRSITDRANEAFNDVKRDYDIAIARTTRDLGWYGRGMFQEQTADFHWIVRQLRWLRFCIALRDGIIETLSSAFVRAGKVFGEQPRLVVRNLPTLGDIDEAERKLMGGGGTRFDLVLKPFLNERE